MEEYALDSRNIFAILKEKNVNHLYHANTVKTSITFIKNRSLLSRGFVEKNNLQQTKQKSDNEDKEFDVWDDVFLDGADLHSKYKRANHYGPVLFLMKLELLNSPELDKIFVTKNNPMYWKKGESLDLRYYRDIEELKNDYLTGKRLDSRIMFTIRHPDIKIKLNKYLNFIGLDKPNILLKFTSGETKNIGDIIKDRLENELKENGLGHKEVKFRHQDKMGICSCAIDYTSMWNFNRKEFERRFKPSYEM